MQYDLAFGSVAAKGPIGEDLSRYGLGADRLAGLDPREHDPEQVLREALQHDLGAAIQLSHRPLVLAGASKPTTPRALLDGWTRAIESTAGYGEPFSAERGRQLYYAEQERKGRVLSCASCHTADPREPGRARNKDLEPLAPSANSARFTDTRKVEKWLRRNCSQTGPSSTPN